MAVGGVPVEVGETWEKTAPRTWEGAGAGITSRSVKLWGDAIYIPTHLFT
jgi:hypothetical protein